MEAAINNVSIVVLRSWKTVRMWSCESSAGPLLRCGGLIAEVPATSMLAEALMYPQILLVLFVPPVHASVW